MSGINFILYSTGRTGSNLLKALLNSIPGINCNGEILSSKELPNNWHGTLNDYLNYYFNPQYEYNGIKLFLPHTKDVQNSKIFGNINTEDVLKELNVCKIIHLRRRNIIKARVSGKLARTAKQYYYNKNTPVNGKSIEMTLDDISAIQNYNKWSLLLFQRMVKEYGCSKVVNLWYEDDLQDPTKWQNTVDKLTNFFDLPNHKLNCDEIESYLPHKTKLLKPWKEHISNFDEFSNNIKCQMPELAKFLEE